MTRLGVTDAQLTKMRAQVLLLMPDTAVVQAVTNVPDGAGGWSETWAAEGTVVCRLDVVSAKTRAEVQAAREGQIVYYELTLPYDTTLDVERRVVVDGVTYEVVEVHQNQSWSVSIRARVAVLDE